MRLRRRFFALFFCSPTHISTAQNDILNDVLPPFLCRGGVSPPAKRINYTATTYVTPYSVILSLKTLKGAQRNSRRIFAALRQQQTSMGK